MPNRKIKHIIATLVGASQQETMDVYDVDAVHKDDIKNDLLTTVTKTYALDAAQGKVLNDKIQAVHDHIYAGKLADGTDLNDVKDAGIHLVPSGGHYMNCPHMVDGSEVAWGFLEVLCAFDASNPTTMQRFYQNSRVWTRFYNPDSGNWFTWTMYNSIRDGDYPFTYRTYTYTYTIAADTLMNITADQFTPILGTPQYWAFFGFRTWTTNNSNVYITRLQHGSGSNVVMTIRNNSNTVQTGTLTVSAIYSNYYTTAWIHEFDESSLA